MPRKGHLAEPPEVVGYPPYVYILRLINAKEQRPFDEVYSSVKNAERKIKLIFREGFSHDIEIVKPNWLVCIQQKTPSNTRCI